MTRRVTRVGESRCGWCMDGIHLPTDRSRGCTRYQAQGRPCPCPDPIHKENPV